MDEVGCKILVKILQCILQSRIDVQKKQIRHFDQINKQILNNKYKHQEELDLQQFLNSLLLAEKYNLMSKLKKQSTYHCVTIVFNLINNLTQTAVQAEVWVVEFQQFRPTDDEHNEEMFQTITALFEDLIVFLNRQPLFSQYQSNLKMRNSFTLQYQISISTKPSASQFAYSILSINRKHTRQRVCRSFLIRISCDFIDPLIENMSASEASRFMEKHKAEEGETVDSLRENSTVISINEKNKKHNIYQYYDKDLDFVFLSSDEETFRKNPKTEVKQINITNYIDDTDEFELLVVSKDEEFFDDTKVILAQFSASQQKYFTL